ncbi:hypothetical protein CGMCC3_g6798 [Colletotrichum fructicola]|nr:uncharacterized protein CGMCC3_g6798 [Colletotrichum fructicola]KAE9577025.1 hypothetical protein CGMCC3_g6798 [Colletotrichum fructicola]
MLASKAQNLAMAMPDAHLSASWLSGRGATKKYRVNSNICTFLIAPW